MKSTTHDYMQRGFQRMYDLVAARHKPPLTASRRLANVSWNQVHVVSRVDLTHEDGGLRFIVGRSPVGGSDKIS